MKRKRTTSYLWMVLILFMTLISLQCEASTRGSLAIETRQGEQVGFYSKSYALLIGVSEYGRDWPDLNSVPGELEKVAEVLAGHGFEVRKVLNPDSETLKQAFEDFIFEYGYAPNNRLLFFYSGHGHSLEQGNKGYLVPVDAPDPRKDLMDFRRRSLDMTRILAWSREMTARHALFLFDSCFSGAIFQTKALPEHPPHITQLTSRKVRQYISAGSADDEVPSRSVFTPSFIKALRGEADFTKDGYVTGTELGMYLSEKVPFYNPGQTPQYGKIQDPNLDEGDFVFVKQDLIEVEQLRREVGYLRIQNTALQNEITRLNSIISSFDDQEKNEVDARKTTTPNPVIQDKPTTHEATRTGDYIKYENGVVRDTKTDLEWFACSEGGMYWKTAQRWVKNLELGGGGWRMPSLDELKTLYQEGLGSRNMTPLLETTGWRIWSKVKKKTASWTGGDVSAFNTGRVEIEYQTGGYALAVRSRKGP